MKTPDSMDDQELKALLQSTDQPLADRQKESWRQLRSTLFVEKAAPRPSPVFFNLKWILATAAVAIVAVDLWSWQTHPIVSPKQESAVMFTQSEQPEVYTSSYYSPQAQAEVVWVSGLDYVNASSESESGQ